MPNTFNPNKLSNVVALRAKENSAYCTVGSKKHFADQLVGKRNGQKYRFVLRDTGKAYEGLAADLANDKISLTEREIELTIRDFRVFIETNAIEGVTDVDWKKEIVEPNGQKLANKVVSSIIASDFGKVGTCFVGSGFVPLARAIQHIKSLTSEDVFGFVDPNVQAILAANGQQFVPVGAPEMYKKGLLGEFMGCETRAQRFLPSVTISATAKTQYDAAVTSAYSQANTGYDTITLGATTLTAEIKKGTPIFLNGVMAADTVGDPTTMQHAFIVLEDATPSSNSVTVKVAKIDISGEGTRDVCGDDGSNFTTSTLGNSLSVTIPEAGTYFMSIIRANGAEEFETLDKIDAAGAEYEKSDVPGFTVHQNRLVDLEKMTDYTRWDAAVLAGVVEPRAISYALIK